MVLTIISSLRDFFSSVILSELGDIVVLVLVSTVFCWAIAKSACSSKWEETSRDDVVSIVFLAKSTVSTDVSSGCCCCLTTVFVGDFFFGVTIPFVRVFLRGFPIS